MIIFDDWTISARGAPIARQYDNLSRCLIVTGDIPDGWEWAMLVAYKDNLNILALEPMEGGIGVALTDDMIPYDGYYRLQLRGTRGEEIRHSNIVRTFIPQSLSGNAQWPTIPSEFTQLEERVQQAANQAKQSAATADQSREQAETAAGQANQSATQAGQAAAQAGTAAGQSAQSANQAQQSAQQAGQSAGQAGTAAVQADQSAAQAGQAAAQAGTSSGQAAQSANQAQQSAQQAGQSAQAAQEAREAIENLGVSAESLPAGSPAAVTKTEQAGAVNLKFGIPAGTPGQDAPQINDAIITDANPWSAKKIVDTLAPPFCSSGAIVTCNPVAGYPLEITSQIVPVQAGNGDPSPDNVRPIRGWTEATLTHNDTPITLPFGQTVYGGTLDWTTGVLTVNSIFLKLDTTYVIRPYQFLDKNGVYFSPSLLYIANRVEGVCSHGICANQVSIPNKSYIWLGVENKMVYWIGILDALGLSTVDEFKTWLNTQNVQIVYPMEEPVTIQLTPQEILALSGTNTIYTDTGDTTVSGRADPNTIIQQLAARIAALEGQAINR